VYAGSCVTGGAVFSMTGGDTSAIGKVAGSVTFGGLRRNYLGNPRSYLLVELIFDGRLSWKFGVHVAAAGDAQDGDAGACWRVTSLRRFLCPSDMALEAKRFRHVAVATPVLAIPDIVTVSPRQQSLQPQ
jgi:hypothetical protein